MVDLMGNRCRPHVQAPFAGLCGWSASVVLIAKTALAADVGTLHGGGYAWTVVIGLLILTTGLAGYLLQRRMVRHQTAQLRRELFERQVAEKELLASDRQLRQSLAEKESLLKEIHHRVKNNLQVVSSLLYLQEAHLSDPKSIEMFRQSQNRIKSMALIHEQLYGTADLARIDFGRYVNELATNLMDAYSVDPAHIQLTVRADEVALPVDVAVPCGLIINELVSNAFKHAFLPHEVGSVEIAVRAQDPGRMSIVVADDGIGFSHQAAECNSTSLGLRLTETLTAQLGGRLTRHADNGSRFDIVLKIPEPLQKEP
jgi:two-component sensor histidine kinase